MRLPIFKSSRYVFAVVSLVILFSLLRVERARGAGHDHSDEMSEHRLVRGLGRGQRGDRARAAAVVAGVRKAADHYTDYRKVLGDVFTIFMPNMPQKVYHF